MSLVPSASHYTGCPRSLVYFFLVSILLKKWTRPIGRSVMTLLLLLECKKVLKMAQEETRLEMRPHYISIQGNVSIL